MGMFGWKRAAVLGAAGTMCLAGTAQAATRAKPHTVHRAAAIAPTMPPCSVSGAVTTCTVSAGVDQPFVVPAGVDVVTVDVIGGWGGNAGGADPGYGGTGLGGAPAEIRAQIMVGAGEQLYFVAGGAGGSSVAGGAGGSNGGGAGGTSAQPTGADGGGGGASDVRVGLDSVNNRILVAAGGGGAGAGDYGGAFAGGAHDANGAGAYSGQSGHVTTGNGGHDFGDKFNDQGASGGFGPGGAGGSDERVRGGGGGGGGYGGGGGGAGYADGGGGGGSSYYDYGFSSPGTPAPTTTATTPAGSDGSITFTYSTSQ